MKVEYWKANYPNFVIDMARFDSPDEPGSGLLKMNQDFMAKLQAARNIANIPFPVTSGYRSPAHDRMVCLQLGKTLIPPDRNEHVLGFAVDIACRDYGARYLIVSAAMAAGIRRIFYDAIHLHLGDCPSLPLKLLGPE